ncbi:MAG: GNAT family N-acetyltransferase, partial [Gammaproteobacteria bacterium]|nr:GNAT family N-acetyltransferase [Gammaproteobacteria bacterium]
LIHWLKAYNIEGLGKEDNEALGQHVEEGMEKATDRWALLIDDKPVSLSGFNAKLPEIVQVGPVWTPPKYRNRGYARALVAMTLQKARQEGARKAILFTDTPAAIKAYEAIGFEKIGAYRLALLKQPLY